MMLKVSIVILNWNGGEQDCVEAIDSALNQDYLNKEIIFVDNGSSDGSYEAVQARFNNVQFVQTGSNKGCPEGRNIGAKHACGDIIAFLENDGVWSSNDIVTEAVNFLSENTNVAALYSAVEGFESGDLDPPVDTHNSGHGCIQYSSTFRGGASFIRRSLFDSSGGFPGDYLRQGEEVFLSYLLIDKGYDIVYWPVRNLRHKGSDYTGKSDAVMYYNYLNELKTITRLYPFAYYPFYLSAKVVINLIRFLKKAKLFKFLELTFIGIAEYRNRKHYTQISISGLKRFNKLKYSDNKCCD